MFRQVLVPVKFSVCGCLAAWHACDVVRAIGGTLTLLHVLEFSESAPHESAPHESRPHESGHPEQKDFGADEAGVGEARYQEAHSCLRQLGLYARCLPSLLIVPALSASDLGEVALAILDAAARTDAQLIMLGLRSHGGPVRGTLGRVVGPVLLGVGVPVQVTPCRPTTGVRSGVGAAFWPSETDLAGISPAL